MNRLLKVATFGFIMLGFAAAAGATNWPGRLSSDANLYIAKNNASTALTQGISGSSTTINVLSTTLFATTGYITIEYEAILCTGKTATSFTGCTRAADGTTATSHASGRNVYGTHVAQHHNGLKDELIAMSTFFLQGPLLHLSTSTNQVSIATSSLPTHGEKLFILGAMRITDSSGFGVVISSSASGSEWDIYPSASGSTAILSIYNGGDRLTITSAGRVGIQTTAPVCVLDINAGTVGLPSASAIRGTLTPGKKGEIVYDSTANEVCLATGTVTTSWARMAAPTVACTH